MPSVNNAAPASRPSATAAGVSSGEPNSNFTDADGKASNARPAPSSITALTVCNVFMDKKVIVAGLVVHSFLIQRCLQRFRQRMNGSILVSYFLGGLLLGGLFESTAGLGTGYQIELQFKTGLAGQMLEELRSLQNRPPERCSVRSMAVNALVRCDVVEAQPRRYTLCRGLELIHFAGHGLTSLRSFLNLGG
jgi:hypothetical protein